jgi:hypothetical protein
MHFFSWQLGLLYRHNHEKFPWVLQRFVPEPKPLRRRAPKRSAPPVAQPAAREAPPR